MSTYEDVMRRRQQEAMPGFVGPQQPLPQQVQGPVMPAGIEDPRNYLEQLLAQSQVPVKPPSMLDRIRAMFAEKKKT